MSFENNILINPETGQEYVNVPPKVAAKFLDVSEPFIYDGLKQGKLPFGIGILGKSGNKWSFNIPVARLKAYKSGVDLSLLSNLICTLTNMQKG